MKRFLFLLLLPVTLGVFAQNDSIEKKALHDYFVANKMYLDDYSKAGAKWNQALKTINGYPELPFNQEGKVEYVFVEDFTLMDKNQLYSRALEYLSLTYGLIPAYLYSNQADGKIICTQSFDLSANSKYTFSYLITVKDKKLMMEFLNIDYETKSGGFYSGDVWIPESKTTTHIDQIFPIILKKQSEWSSYLTLIRQMDDHFRAEVLNLRTYVLNYQLRYTF